MSTRKRQRTWSEPDGTTFNRWPRECGEHWNFYRLSPYAKALLFELFSQYRGRNNGDLSCAWGTVKDRGVGSHRTVQRAEKELIDTGWIFRTRQGGKNRCNLYALTFYDIDECDGKLDDDSLIGKRLSYWKHGGPPGMEDERNVA